jgi:hypothetical protein
MNCLRCGAQSIDGKKFCGDCGAALNTPEEERIRQLATLILEEQFRQRDQKLLEIETAEAIYDRLKKLAAPTVIAITVAVAIVGIIGYREFNSLLGAMRVAETEAVGRIKSQTDQETQHIRDEGAGERASLQTGAAREAAAFRKDVSGMRAESAKSSKDLEAEVKRARAKLVDAQGEIAQLMEQGTALKDKYDRVGTELAIIQRLTPETSDNVVGLGKPISSGQLVALTQALRTYSIDSSGPEVEQIQSRLKELGCYDGAVDGKYGVSTKEAVERFNRTRGEAFPAGVVDSLGWSMLFGPIYPAPKSVLTIQGAVAVSSNVSLSRLNPGELNPGAMVPVLGAVRCGD